MDRNEDFDIRLTTARAAWPKLSVDDDAFARWLDERAAQGKLPPADHAADLYLACACALGAAGALEAFERYTSDDVQRILARVAGDASRSDEVRQVLREKLFVSVGGQLPKINAYAGRGPLKRWVAATAIRTALDLRRGAANQTHAPLPPDLAIRDADPELGFLKARYKAEFEGAVRAGFASLEPRDKTLLQLHYWERLSVDRLGAIYKVGRSTAARWVADSRDKLLRAIRSELMRRAKLTDAEFDSIAALVVSDLDISISRMFERLS
jgi:RNA polymerase sigma-70 factor (ECF subfamily)